MDRITSFPSSDYREGTKLSSHVTDVSIFFLLMVSLIGIIIALVQPWRQLCVRSHCTVLHSAFVRGSNHNIHHTLQCTVGQKVAQVHGFTGGEFAH
jgi:hypothetical protein